MFVFQVGITKKAAASNEIPGDYKNITVVTPRDSYDAVIAAVKRENPGWELGGIAILENVLVLD